VAILTVDEIKKLNDSCEELLKEENIVHVGVINPLGHLIAGGFKTGVEPLLDDVKVRMVYMQMQLDFKMRQELDDVLGPIDYIASRRTRQLIITVPLGDLLVLIATAPDADDKKIIKKAEELFDDLHISVI